MLRVRPCWFRRRFQKSPDEQIMGSLFASPTDEGRCDDIPHSIGRMCHSGSYIMRSPSLKASLSVTVAQPATETCLERRNQSVSQPHWSDSARPSMPVSQELSFRAGGMTSRFTVWNTRWLSRASRRGVCRCTSITSRARITLGVEGMRLVYVAKDGERRSELGAIA
ncbi:hypothetical protein BDP81DRAFT_433619 [Colletotrichum phormii]|uniref:Uncharacterized protein n=1 Tax=Colletotrichum phormii TaxID=359342 RepID=A0AAJ0EEK5_9PEZI|nr:uncharacterized protein BDP81DRAFT_433619 [Colletotrichum phormii]KAK1634060.1 hypothetical protein BDP81DRAFT_433619 [Colletotrichum phormii]